MKTIKKQCEEAMFHAFTGHPLREAQHRIQTLEQLVLKLAQQIDKLNNYS